VFGLGDASILTAYRYPRLKLSGSCMSSRSVALVNTLSPDVDNANTGYHAAREICCQRCMFSILILYVSVASGKLDHMFGLSGSLVGWISPTGCHALAESYHVLIQ